MTLNKKNILKISMAIFTVIVFFSFLGYHDICVKHEAYIERAETENKLLQNQFDEILKKYDSLNSTIEEAELIEVEEAIKSAIESSNNFENNFDAKNENKSLESQIERLKNAISEDSENIVEINDRIQNNKKSLDQLESIKSNDKRIRHDKLSALNVTARGVKILSDLYAKKRERKIQQIRVCFTLQGNEFIRQGNKDIYIQVVNPKNQIISAEDTSIALNDIKLLYSAKVDALYNQKDLDVCAYVNLESNKTIKGKYIINIYNSFSKIGSTIFEYE
ncbi:MULTISPECIES: hypothetical protein [Flavobacterium]|uniref:Chromosome partitioning protein ParA n=1 Tax=Flavobacterium jumunjinense TaxID=998845 RepID=A0ABV5GPJ6_9FLAO|nr:MULTISPECIES: hypothetical protein [Flavobacterium]